MRGQYPNAEALKKCCGFCGMPDTFEFLHGRGDNTENNMERGRPGKL